MDAPTPEDPVSASSAVERAFRRRAERAWFLARDAIAAHEPLRFAAGLFREQGKLAAALEALNGRRPLSGRLTEDLPGLLEASSGLLRFAAEQGPEGLASVARARSIDEGPLLGSQVAAFWSAERAPQPDYLSRALLRPYVELLANLRISPGRPLRTGHCPFCGGAPWIAGRRPAEEGDGDARLLGCALCGGEWPFARIRCPACPEQDPERLPCFRSDDYPAVRIEACETCHRYVKSIDLTLAAEAIPEVDDLVSLGMDLWAAKEGFERIEPGLAGI